jgi:hypothetical protein
MRAGALGAYGATGLALPSFPKPGGGGPAPTLVELDGDGQTEVVAGTGADSLLYIYDAGAATWGDTARAWLTPRGDAARTGARGGPALPQADDLAPATIADLAVDSLASDAMALRWTAAGDDGMTGRAACHELHLTALRTQAASFQGGLRIDVPASDTAGTPERRVIGGLTPGTTYYASVRARDAWGNAGAPSDVLMVTLPRGPAVQLSPPGIAALRARTQPARPPVELLWQAGRGARAESQAIGIFDVSGRLRRELAVGADSAGTVQWDGRDRDGRRVSPGLYFARLEAGGARAEARLVVLP